MARIVINFKTKETDKDCPCGCGDKLLQVAVAASLQDCPQNQEEFNLCDRQGQDETAAALDFMKHLNILLNLRVAQSQAEGDSARVITGKEAENWKAQNLDTELPEFSSDFEAFLDGEEGDDA